MVLLTDCFACRAGDHSRHHEVIQDVPPGMLGGVRCACKGDCAERWERMQKARQQATIWVCSFCKGKGCSECDRTGQRVRTRIDVGDGLTFSVSGSAVLTDEAQEALAAVARAAYAQLAEPVPRGNTPEAKDGER